jgi:catechol 2,3-dioxygenase-like lactoylglutathione lyase family enzyme
MSVNVRYIVDEIDASVAFYTEHLGFHVEARAGNGFAMLSLGDLRLLLNTPGAGGAGQAAPDGTLPTPGGWNRFQIVVDDLDGVVHRLESAGVDFRSPVVTGNAGRQVVVADPSGNAIELLEPAGR